MGQWNITIKGTGAHHNRDYPKDVDRMASAFVKELRDAGHQVEGASITYGGRQDLVASPSKLPDEPGPPTE